MKKILLPVFLLFSCTAFSQLSKGALLLEGAASLNFANSEEESSGSTASETKNHQISLRPALGIMLSEKWMLGGGIGYEYYYGFAEFEGFYPQSSKQIRNMVFLSVFVTRYIPLNEKLYFTATLDAAVGLGTIKTELTFENDEPSKSTDDSYQARISAIPGLTYFISDKWAITGSIGQVYANFNWRKSEDQDTKNFNASGGLSLSLNTFSIGAQYFLRNGGE